MEEVQHTSMMDGSLPGGSAAIAAAAAACGVDDLGNVDDLGDVDDDLGDDDGICFVSLWKQKDHYAHTFLC
eukprot:8780093-Ditylum_brightwellii.AAC.1